MISQWESISRSIFGNEDDVVNQDTTEPITDQIDNSIICGEYETYKDNGYCECIDGFQKLLGSPACTAIECLGNSFRDSNGACSCNEGYSLAYNGNTCFP